ncbi:AAA family ATPase [Actinoplanes missouriensis]|uniref:AAA family ATPase n=1 Tax=Actinoplanes missouriensis TaxID=1866 RepID=UPI0033ED9307
MKPQIVLTGNIADEHLMRSRDDESRSLLTTTEAVVECLRASAYQLVMGWDPVDGPIAHHFADPKLADDVVPDADRFTGEDQADPDRLAALMREVVEGSGARAALIVEDAPLLAGSPQDPDLHRVYLTGRRLARTAPRIAAETDGRNGLYNTIVWIVGREADLPPWLLDPNAVRVIRVPPPGMSERRRLSATRLRALPEYTRLPADAREAAALRLARLTDGFSLRDVATSVQLAAEYALPLSGIEEAVRTVRSADRGAPWREPDLRRRISGAAVALNRVVLGQRRAVQKVADVLARAALGLSGAQSASHPTRPQGVLFLAGPTGVGKTEVAKQVAELVFGRPEAMLRFDMSEFSEEHAKARLIGAPPGYRGHGDGGELTEAVRRKPFSLLLFDEIEKAHLNVLDMFLQILEDGRLTDSSGVTTYFGDTLVVFTSNLGTVTPSARSPRAEIPADQLESQVIGAIRRRFIKLGRPELLNRIGQNIIVFDYIDGPTAVRILERNLETVLQRVGKQTGHRLTIGVEARLYLEERAQRPEVLAFGGRGVGSVVEACFLNPLARVLVDADPRDDYEIVRIAEDDEGVRLETSHHRREA